jgi:AI-2 transport protein TqsA
MANVLVNVAKNSLMIFFITMFILLESTRFKQKSERAFGPKNKLTTAMVEIASEIKRYMLFKSLISLLTGFLVYISLKVAGVDFPLVWGILAFILNFIPSIGSIMASIPPVALALIQFSDPIQGVVMVGLILGVIQVSIGNFLDPKIMGDSLNISPLIIFLSMVFWGWLWGPMGMLIAVPLAVCIKVTAGQIDKLKSLAIMMEAK